MPKIPAPSTLPYVPDPEEILEPAWDPAHKFPGEADQPTISNTLDLSLLPATAPSKTGISEAICWLEHFVRFLAARS